MEGNDETGENVRGRSAAPRRSSRLSANRLSSSSLAVDGGGEGRGRGGRGRGPGNANEDPVLIVAPEVTSSALSSSFSLPAAPAPLPIETSEQLIERRRNERAIIAAAKEGNVAAVSSLHEAGVSLNIIEEGYRARTLLIIAAWGKHLPVVQYLINNGADVNMQDRDGETALVRAVMQGHSEIVRVLLGAGADCNLGDSDGVTPLMNAAHRGRSDIVRDLIAAGAALDTVDDYDYTAMIYAACSNKGRCVGILLVEGADDSLINDCHDDAFSAAVMYNCPYADRAAWEAMKGRVTASDVRTALVSALAASTAPLVDTPTTPLQNFFHRPEALKMVERIVWMWSGLEVGSSAPLDPYADWDGRFEDRPDYG